MKFDVAIVGGGMAGATLACALSRHSSSKIALIDAAPQPMLEDPRLIALNYGSICLFKNLQLFEFLKPYAAPIQEVHVSHRGRFGATRIRSQELNLSALGYVIPAKQINAVLEQALQQLPITLLRSTHLIGLTEEKEGLMLQLNTPKSQYSIQARKVIAADGSHSTVRDLLAIPTETHDYDQNAIVTTLTLKRSHQSIAYERFVRRGAIAMLPLTENRCAMIWTTQRDHAGSLMQMQDTDFLAQLQAEFGSRLGRLQSMGQRHSFPLQLIRVKNPVYNDVVFIGNAAHTMHPLAAQGFNLALYEAAMLAQVMSGQSVDPAELRKLMSDSMPQKVNLHLSGCLNWLFSMDFPPVNFVRQMGMIGMDICGIIKKQLAAYPAGRGGRIPWLFREYTHRTSRCDF